MELTREDLDRNLRDLGLREDDAVEVHSSLSSLGFVHGGASTVVDALMNVVGKNGALVMSNYPLSRPLPVTSEERAKGIAWKLRKLPEDTRERTVTGAISDDFRWRPDVVCGTGIHRVCAWGRDAELHSKGYQHLLDIEGWVLLIGVGLDRCSSLHLTDNMKQTEEARQKARRIYGPAPPKVTIPEEVRRQYPPDIILGERDAGNPSGGTGGGWGAFDETDRLGLIKRGEIGNAQCMLFKLKDLISRVEKERLHGPFPHSAEDHALQP